MIRVQILKDRRYKDVSSDNVHVCEDTRSISVCLSAFLAHHLSTSVTWQNSVLHEGHNFKQRSRELLCVQAALHFRLLGKAAGGRLSRPAST